jgi:dipeptidase D
MPNCCAPRQAAALPAGQTAKLVAVHAGTECGALTNVLPGLDAVSIGPTIQGEHTINEVVSISSVQQFWQYLLLTLEWVAAGALAGDY